MISKSGSQVEIKLFTLYSMIFMHMYMDNLIYCYDYNDNWQEHRFYYSYPI
ncbi:hypothetical protein MNV_1410010 [Candidatus Methanoperedens nitroreducens]|uniref:Uncharacterized protein n=1 Tax=Candidatus Methanoperedens nitratireducens TaxID=1392998 RepID=A0A284VKZ0_9EURY|nr:hypothetical protein MNV_1410010 [Candidatus Methanoperedens nitroreducens]